MKIQKHILIVDDEKDLGDALGSFLLDCGYTTETCTSVDSALSIFRSKTVHLIISDITMPNKDGLEFFNLIKDELKQKLIPFVFMTGHSNKLDLKAAYEIGVDEFINKPFEFDDMKSVAAILLNGDAEEKHKNEKFYKVDLNEYLQGSSNKYDIFLKVSENFLCLAKKGQELLPERLANYSRKGMKHIYLTAVDFSDYIGMQIDVSTIVMNNKPFPKSKKIRLFNHFCKTLSESAFQENMQEEIYKKVYSSFENYTQIALDNQDLSMLIESFRTYDNTAADKSVIITFLALAVFHQWNWVNPRHLSRIALAALLCDVGLKDLPTIANKSVHDLTHEERKEYEKHPLISYMILSKIKKMPPEILFVASQHHENEAGLGFPHKLTKLKIHPYARIIHALVEFVDNVGNFQSKTSVKECLEVLANFEQKMISMQVLKTLYIIFDIPVPDSLKKLLLPADTTRLT
ncbi:MAG: response regulator [Bdellovibrio sp.]|nr:response regulator [Bdellovibrio sp.]